MTSHALPPGLRRGPCQANARSPTPPGCGSTPWLIRRGREEGSKLSPEAFPACRGCEGMERSRSERAEPHGSSHPRNFGRGTTLHGPAERARCAGGSKQLERKCIFMQLRHKTDTMDFQKSSRSQSRAASTGRHARQRKHTNGSRRKEGLILFFPKQS